MINLRRAKVLEVRPGRPGVTDLVVDVAGSTARAIAYPDLTGEVSPGDIVVVNTTAVDLGLGTGGVHVVVAVEGRERAGTLDAHTMKLRYTPVQTAVPVVEETHREILDDVDSLGGLPVVICALHSAVPAVAIGARAAAPGARLAYVMTDAGALHAGFSDTIAWMRRDDLIASCITTGQAVGGDLEAVTIYGGLAAGCAVVRAGVLVVSMGPGNLGTASRWGSGALTVAGAIDAAAAMGGRPIVAPRVSFTDERERHRGVSHHTLTALALAHVRATVVVPRWADGRGDRVREQLAPARERHDVVEISHPLDDAARALEAAPDLRSMGRSYAQDPEYFLTAAAAGILAATSTR